MAIWAGAVAVIITDGAGVEGTITVEANCAWPSLALKTIQV
jgi:hypothetical protein